MAFRLEPQDTLTQATRMSCILAYKLRLIIGMTTVAGEASLWEILTSLPVLS